MSVPSSYTEETLASFQLVSLSDVAGILDWTADTPEIQEAVTETLLAYGVEDIASATDIRKLRALARVQAWQAAADALASRYDFEADGGRYDREKLHAHALAQLAAARAQVASITDPTPPSSTGGGVSTSLRNVSTW